MFKRLAFVSALNLALLATGAMAEPWIKKYDPPAGYSVEKPAYAHFKEITVTRKSSRDLDFDITLQGPIPKNMPKDYGLDYYVYFDLEDYESTSSKRQTGDFQQDHWVAIYLEPNSTTSKNFKTYILNLFHRSKLWTFDVTNVRALNDKVSFSIKSNLFNEKDISIRLLLSASTPYWAGGNASKPSEKKNQRVNASEPFNLPTK